MLLDMPKNEAPVTQWTRTRTRFYRIIAYGIAAASLVGMTYAMDQWKQIVPTDTLKWWIFCCLSFITAIASLLAVFVESRLERANLEAAYEQREEDLVKEAAEILATERARHLANLETIVAPIVDGLPALLTSSEQDLSARSLLNRLLGACKSHLSSNGSDASANYYVLTGNRRGKFLTRADQTGLYARPNFRKTKDDPESTAVVDRVLAGTPAFCRNTSDPDEQRKWALNPAIERNYKAFISVPVISSPDEDPLGMLSVNCSTLDVLQEHDVRFLNAVGKMLIVLHPYLQIGPSETEELIYASEGIIDHA